MFRRMLAKVFSMVAMITALMTGTSFASSPFSQTTTKFSLVNAIGAGPLLAEVFGLLGVAATVFTIIMYVVEHFKRNSAGAFKHLIGGAIVATLCFGAFGVIALMTNFGTQAGTTIGNASSTSTSSASS